METDIEYGKDKLSSLSSSSLQPCFVTEDASRNSTPTRGIVSMPDKCWRIGDHFTTGSQLDPWWIMHTLNWILITYAVKCNAYSSWIHRWIIIRINEDWQRVRLHRELQSKTLPGRRLKVDVRGIDVSTATSRPARITQNRPSRKVRI